jgi:hypothetical protein
MQPQPCKFCRQLPSYEPLDVMERYQTKIFFCHPCQTEYLYNARESINSWFIMSIYTTINNKLYRWTEDKLDFCRLWIINRPGIPGKTANDDLTLLYHLEGKNSLNITPANINDKIKTWITLL